MKCNVRLPLISNINNHRLLYMGLFKNKITTIRKHFSLLLNLLSNYWYSTAANHSLLEVGTSHHHMEFQRFEVRNSSRSPWNISKETKHLALPYLCSVRRKEMHEVDCLTYLNIPSTYEPSRIGLETQNQVQKWRCAQKHHRILRGIVSMTPTVLSSYTIRHDRNLKQKTWPLRSTFLSLSELLDASCINHITTNLLLDAATAPKEWLPLSLLHNSCYLSSEEPPKACFFWNHRRSKNTYKINKFMHRKKPNVRNM